MIIQHKGRIRRKRTRIRERGNSGPNVTDINRFVVGVCRRLKEKKSYLVWAAVGCLGVSALSDVVTEEAFGMRVEAIQACGGQKTADGRCFRTGGGILWSILKVHDSNAYKVIMRRGKEFEVIKNLQKQFHPHNIKQEPMHNKDDSSQRVTSTLTDQNIAKVLDGLQEATHVHNQLEQSTHEQKRASVYDRLQVPVAYDDLFEGENTGDGRA